MFAKQVRHNTGQLALVALAAVIALWLVGAGVLLQAWAAGALGR